MYTIDYFENDSLSYVYGKIKSIYHYYIGTYLWEYNDINEVFPNIYISDIGTAYNQSKLDELGITHIINAIYAIEPAYPEKYSYLSVDLRDSIKEDISKEFDKVSDYIDLALRDNGKVLVHCIAGISRSASLVASYLINKKQLTFDETLQILKNKRTKIEPNDGFKKQLENYSSKEKIIKNKQPFIEILN